MFHNYADFWTLKSNILSSWSTCGYFRCSIIVIIKMVSVWLCDSLIFTLPIRLRYTWYRNIHVAIIDWRVAFINLFAYQKIRFAFRGTNQQSFFITRNYLLFLQIYFPNIFNLIILSNLTKWRKKRLFLKMSLFFS